MKFHFTKLDCIYIFLTGKIIIEREIYLIEEGKGMIEV